MAGGLTNSWLTNLKLDKRCRPDTTNKRVCVKLSVCYAQTSEIGYARCFCRAASSISYSEQVFNELSLSNSFLGGLCILLMCSLSDSTVYSYRHCRYHLLCSHSHIPFNTAIAMFCCFHPPLSQSNIAILKPLRSPAVAILRCRNLLLSTTQYVADMSMMSQPSLSLCLCRDLLTVRGLTVTPLRKP